ncbi:MAG: 2-oxoisovalerate ferredoxin oxidoreductase alpha subunit [Candidatus Methanomethylophilaceae archaeon]|nr:2-oxoisovalerate ferredoxin oxidoreductase alpha subunit [Candidatus Methanomethylophilaceae archaeon]
MRKFIKGNEAVIVGALYAGCDAYFGYPITPASEIAHAAAEYFPALGREFLQAECETGTINMIYGAASAGALAMTASSGPGISLMQEGISYLAGAQLPAVIVNVMRAGPGLGNIGPEQGDYNQAVKGGGHGNYHTIVLAPNSVQEMCDLTMKCFELSTRYRNPALLLADAVLGQMMESLKIPERPMKKEDFSAWCVRGDAKTRGNLICSIYLEPDRHEKHVMALQEKYKSMQVEAMAERYMCEDADLIISAYGSCSRIGKSVVDALRKEGLKAGLFRPITLYPFPHQELNEAVKDKDVLVLELSNGQYRDDLLLNLDTYDNHVELVNRMGGNLISVESAMERAHMMLGGKT